jgi:hypothetical protein
MNRNFVMEKGDKMKKAVFAAFLCAVAVFIAAGCGSVKSGARQGAHDGVRDGISGLFRSGGNCGSGDDIVIRAQK